MKTMLLDGNSIMNRAFYAIPVLTNQQGDFTNGVYGFLNILFRFLDEEKPEQIAVAFDLPAPTLRHEKFEAYKGTTKGMPEELRPQFPTLKALLRKMRVPIVELAGYEADDILGTLARRAQQQGKEVVVVSGDRDLLQIASEHIQIRIPKTKGGKTEVEDYYGRDVEALFGVTPTEYIDVKALMGDASDNIPGVPGIGEKTAFKIIQEYKTLENALAHAAEIKPKKASENLLAYQEQAVLSKELATIITDAPVLLDEEEALLSPDKLYSQEALEEITRLEFKSFVSRFSQGQRAQANDGFAVTVWEQDDEIIRGIDGLCQAQSVAYKLILWDGELMGVAFASEAGKGSFAPVTGQRDESALLQLLAPFFTSRTPKVALDLKRDLVYLSRFGLEASAVVFDVMLAGYILDASSDQYEYNDVAFTILGENYPPAEEFFGKGKHKKERDGIAMEDLAGFACRQAEVMLRAYPLMRDKIRENGQEELYNDIELPLVYVLKDMEIYGIKIDKHALIAFGQDLDAKIEAITDRIYALAGEEFNLNSPKQMGVILFEKLGLKGGKKTKTGYSTAADVLEKLADKHEIVALILEYRTYAKLKSTYVDGLLNVLDEKTGKIYSTFNQAVTATGRISSTEPNLQNIPIRLPLGRELRKIFIPSDESFLFGDADYSQIELRLLAAMSGDETFIQAFCQGQDIHRLTASQVFKIPFEQVTAAQRSNAKAVNFGIVYGISAYSLSQDLGIPVREAERYIQGYFEKYPKVRQYLDDTIGEARRRGYAETIFRRRRYIPELSSENFVQRSFGERVAMNMPVQGSAADVIKIAMVRVYNRLKREGLQSRLILQVHDELLLEIKRDEMNTVIPLLKKEMEQAARLSVPLEADVQSGENWYEAH